MILFGVQVPVIAVIIAAVLILGVVALIIVSIAGEKKKAVPDLDTREEFGDFHGLLTKEDFDTRADDHMLEVYRMQWINAKPGDEKDNYLLLYLALKQLNKEQDQSESEWTQEKCEARMDEIIKELSEKTGLKLIENELTETEFDAYFNSLPDEDDDSEVTEADGENG